VQTSVEQWSCWGLFWNTVKHSKLIWAYDADWIVSSHVQHWNLFICYILMEMEITASVKNQNNCWIFKLLMRDVREINCGLKPILHEWKETYLLCNPWILASGSDIYVVSVFKLQPHHLLNLFQLYVIPMQEIFLLLMLDIFTYDGLKLGTVFIPARLALC
jgi:hypothetical protein